jgi:hypothetical protein
VKAREARREAHAAVAALVDVNMSREGDLYAGTEGWSEEDLDRFDAALERIVATHRRYAGGAE